MVVDVLYKIKGGYIMFTLEKTERTGHGLKERLTIKSFKNSKAMYEFLNTGYNSLKWSESTKNLKRGIYAYAGGQYHNVKTLDPSILAHI